RLQSPAFRQRVQTLRGEMLAAAAGKLCGAAGKAVDVLQALLDDPTARVRLRAALGILTSLLRVREQTDLEERLGRFEVGAEPRMHAGANGRVPWPQGVPDWRACSRSWRRCSSGSGPRTAPAVRPA